MEYEINGKKHEINITKKEIKISEFLEEINEDRESVIVRVNGKIKTEFDSIKKGDRVELFRTVSSG